MYARLCECERACVCVCVCVESSTKEFGAEVQAFKSRVREEGRDMVQWLRTLPLQGI